MSSAPSSAPDITSPRNLPRRPRSAALPLLSGALAGLTVDVSLYPLDTIKTRLQSSRGFLASGGFSGVYRGLGSVALGSAPGGALFFVVYEGAKTRLGTYSDVPSDELKQGNAGFETATKHILAASLGEVAACAVRVPTEVVKQRAQAVQAPSSAAALRDILRKRKQFGLSAVWRELYRGWGITVLREVPFTAIQFPLWEALKRQGVRRRIRKEHASSADESLVAARASKEAATTFESAAFGCASGGIAAAATTPLDVLKTRMMLATEKQSLAALIRTIMRDEGSKAFLKGIGPRVAWISIGGAVFLGSYQWGWNMLSSVL